VRALRTVAALLSRVLIAVGAAMLIPAVVALLYSEWVAAEALALSGLASMAVGLVGVRVVKLPMPSEVRPSEALITSAVGWLLAALVGSAPYVLSGCMNSLDAYFESMSGFTTTGMTLIAEVESWPRGLLLWRAFTQWLGGVGIVLFLLLFIAPGGVGAWRLYVAEAREERLTIRARDTVKAIWAIYVGYTAACAIMLIAAGMEPYEALCHSFTALSTGGFSTRTASLAAFSNPAVEAILIAFMIVGAVNFVVHSLLLRLRLRKALGDPELQALLAILAGSTLLMAFDLAAHGLPLGESIRLAAFQATSIMTTTGYTTIDVNALPPLSQALLLALMVVGGSLCSTAGGVKVARLIVLGKLAQREVAESLLPPTAVKPIKVKGEVLELSDAIRVAGFFFAYILIAALATLMLAAEGHSLAPSLSLALSALGNVGPAYASLFSLGPASKLTLVFCMWAGRLELMPVLTLLSHRAWRDLIGSRPRLMVARQGSAEPP
jgi:trk system potassium uptake protein TrkH